MIRVTVELISAIHSSRNRVLAMMEIANDGVETRADPALGTYTAATYRGRTREALDQRRVQRRGRIEHWPRERHHVWNLVARLLGAMGYDEGPRP